MNFWDLQQSMTKYKFQPIAYPDEDIRPLMVIVNYYTGATPKGTLQDFMLNVPVNIPRPNLIKSLNVLEGQSLANLKAGIKGNVGEILKSVFGKFSAKFSGDISSASTLQYRFADIQHCRILEIPILDFLYESKPKPLPHILSFINEEDKAFIVTDILRSGVFGMIAQDQKGTNINMELALGEVAGASLSAETKKAFEGYMLYNNPEHPLPFAVRAFPFWYKKDEETGQLSWKYSSLPMQPHFSIIRPGVHYAAVKPSEIVPINKT